VKKILLFARDPGGANTIIPLFNAFKAKGYDVNLYGKDVALEKFGLAGLNFKNIYEDIAQISSENISDFLKKIAPDLIITGTSADDMTEKLLWNEANKLFIPSFAIIDQWINYGIRFSPYGVGEIATYKKNPKHPYLPTKICVMDEIAKQEAENEGLPAEKLIVTGQPYFQALKENFEKISEINKKTKKIIIFVSEPITDTYGNSDFWGYTEKTVFSDFLEELENFSRETNEKFDLIIKLHPKENKNNYDDVKPSENIDISIDTTTDSLILIKKSDLIVGMSSMFLIEASILGKEVLSIQTGLCRENPFILDRIGKIKSVLSKSLIKHELKKTLKHREGLYYNFKVVENPVENILKEAEKYL